MTKLLVIMAIALPLAYASEQNTRAILASGRRYTVWNDWAYLALVAVLVLFSGLRTGYNDTGNYISSFKTSEGLAAFWPMLKQMNPFENPVFYLFEHALKDITANAQWLIFITAALTQCCFLLFFKRYSYNFTFSVFLFFALGTINVTLAAMKQVCAMAIATLAFPYLERKQWSRYYLIVLFAMLVHTYALAYAVLPLFTIRPWKLFTYLFVLAVVAVVMNFREAISAFMDQAEELGKTLYEEEIFDNHTVNMMRAAVYAVAPLFSLCFARWIYTDSRTMDHVLVHMSIISFSFMAMGTQAGANMFARMAHYFELGTICCLPWMLQQTFERRSYRLVSGIAVACFLFFFIYANGISASFDAEFRSTNIFALFR